MHEDLAILFWTKVNRPGPGICWEWLGAKTKTGQGIQTIWFEEEGKWKTKSASHIAIYLTKGFWPTRKLPRLCGTTSCVNPKHYRVD